MTDSSFVVSVGVTEGTLLLVQLKEDGQLSVSNGSRPAAGVNDRGVYAKMRSRLGGFTRTTSILLTFRELARSRFD